MNEKRQSEWSAYVAVVESGIDGFVEELRTIDIVDLISFIQTEHFPNLEDLITSSTELFFQPEMLVFAWTAGVDLRWDSRPLVTFGMEFRHPTLSLFFDLTIGADERLVEVLGVSFEKNWPDPVAQVRRAFADARLPEGRRAVALAPRSLRRGSIGRSTLR